MGFFSDLKEDLSQAVNELMPEEALEAAMAGNTETDDMLSDEQLMDMTPVGDETPETVDDVNLSSMLDKLEGMDAVNEPLEEEVISSDDMAGILIEEPLADPEEPEMITMPEPEVNEEPELIPEEIVEPEPFVEEEVRIPESEPEAETIEEPEPEPVLETELQEEQEISGLSGEEEEKMDEQTQTQEQTQVQTPVNRVAVDETAVVTEGMTITGDIVSEGSMELIGTVNGNLDIYGKLNITGTIQGDSKAAEIYAEGAKITGEVNSEGSVKIGQSSVVIGNISAASAVVAGAVKGDIDVRGPVILDTTAIVMGNIKSKSVQINNGAVIEGMCSQCYADVNPTSFFEEFKKNKK
ncbi:MAG: polymer-forming cytoskeletal protein [Lachnospiraceae bacterium]|nr:polymer-forming cytoskeletal protein [Lachnospiraceae bacterium]